MKRPLPELRVGDPIRYETTLIFPLRADETSPVDYVLAEVAMRRGQLTITELDHAGSVGYLIVENRGDRRALLLEGELLAGAKQNRAVNTSILVPARSSLKIPVSCVEQGRWKWSSSTFAPESRHVPPSLRVRLKRSVAMALRHGGDHVSDQSGIWQSVARQQAAHAAPSPTRALADVFAARDADVKQASARLPYVEDATGFVIVTGSTIASLDCFDRAETCRVAWERAVPGLVLDAGRLRSPTERAESVRGAGRPPSGRPSVGDEELPTAEDVERFIELLARASWKPVPTVGEGQELRATSALGVTASALELRGDLVHASAVNRVA